MQARYDYFIEQGDYVEADGVNYLINEFKKNRKIEQVQEMKIEYLDVVFT